MMFTREILQENRYIRKTHHIIILVSTKLPEDVICEIGWDGTEENATYDGIRLAHNIYLYKCGSEDGGRKV